MPIIGSNNFHEKNIIIGQNYWQLLAIIVFRDTRRCREQSRSCCRGSRRCREQRLSVFLIELEQADEAGHGEDLADFVAEFVDEHALAFGFGALQDAEEDAQAAGGDVFELAAVEDDVALDVVDERLELLLHLRGCARVESALEIDDLVVVFFYNCCLHNVVCCLII